MLTAAMTAALYLICHEAFGLSQVAATAIAFVFGFGFRLTAQTFGWEEWEPWEPPAARTPEATRKTLGEGLEAEFESGDPGHR